MPSLLTLMGLPGPKQTSNLNLNEQHLVRMHGDVLHLIVNSAWLLAFGTPLVRRMGSIRFIAFSAVCGIAGALVFWALNPGLLAPMVGASGAISGMMGGLLFVLEKLHFIRIGLPLIVGLQVILNPWSNITF